ncbi:MAG: hypothetical protein FJW14_13020 [Acidimicrobiia bacterium]|nr:hypothetical protein [Acidimicrobiia bacterium]
MNDVLVGFLVNLATDSTLQQEYAADPLGVMSRAGLSGSEQSALHSRDSARVRSLLGLQHADTMTQFDPGPDKSKTKRKAAKSAKKTKKTKKARKTAARKRR